MLGEMFRGRKIFQVCGMSMWVLRPKSGRQTIAEAWMVWLEELTLKIGVMRSKAEKP